MRNIKLIVSYDGTDFSGWQRQPDLRTVQGVLEETVQGITGSLPAMNVSGRTDAGVHAIGQVAHFLTVSSLSTRVILKALNAMLPLDIRVQAVEDMPQSFHCTLDTISKRYRYVIDNGWIADPFTIRYAWHVYPKLDAEAMRRAGRALIGRHDFRSFETNWPNRMSSVRTIFDLEVVREGERVIVEVEADGFLYNMVRAITGTLVWVGTGRRTEAFPGEAMKAESRAEAGVTAPPQGLFLLWARYS